MARFRRSVFQIAAKARHRLAGARILRHLPLMRYSYLLDPSSAIVVDELNLAFVPIPKVANRSIKAAVMSLTRPDYKGDPHRAGWNTVPVSMLETDSRFRFGFVRHPLDRLYSLYSQKIVYYARELGKPVLFWRHGRRFHADMNFDAFVEAVAAVPDRIADRHFRSQHTWVYRGGRPLLDFVGRFEHLARDWDVVREHIGAPLPALPHWNKSAHGDFREAYSRRAATLARERYAQDLELFGYA